MAGSELLVVVDMQKDFVTGALGTREAERALAKAAELVKRKRAEGAEIVFTLDTHGEDYLHTQEGRHLPVPHCIRGTDGWQLCESLAREEGKRFEKPCFGSVSLAEYVRAGGYKKVTLCGVCTDICVVSNALLVKAYCPETEVSVVREACAGVTPERHEAAIATMESCQIGIE